MIKTVIFDLGGVLIENPNIKIYHEFSKILKVPFDDCRTAFRYYIRDFDRGDLSTKEFFEKSTKKLGVKNTLHRNSEYDAFKKAYNPDKGVFSLALNLHKQGYKIGLLSNLNVDAINFLQTEAKSDFEFFDIFVFSALVNVSKPKRKIYELMLEKLNVNPEQTLFIDDVEANVEGAKKVGMNAIRFENLEKLKEELKKLQIVACDNCQPV